MSNSTSRPISKVTKDTLALILAGGQGSRLHELTEWRAKPAVPFGGKFRIIDFALSNCINSGIRRVGVATQYKAHSLVRHIGRGWSGFKAEFNEFVEILPASKRVGEGWYTGTADAVYQNLDIIRTHSPAYVLVLGGDHIYKMDYGPLVESHERRDADMTLCCVEVSVKEAAGTFGVVKIDENGRVLEFQEKPAEPAEMPGKPGRVLASMGNYVFKTDFLYEQLIHDADNEDSSHDFGHDILPRIVETNNVFAFRLGDEKPANERDKQPYWRDVGTLDALWEANMELVEADPELDLYDNDWPVYTYQMQLPSAKFVHDTGDRRGMAVNSIVSGGCIVSGGQVSNSLLFSNVRVNSYCDIQDSVIMPDVQIGRYCKIQRAIVDSGTIIPEGAEIGLDAKADKANGFRVTESGVTLVTPDNFQQLLHRLR